MWRIFLEGGPPGGGNYFRLSSGIRSRSFSDVLLERGQNADGSHSYRERLYRRGNAGEKKTPWWRIIEEETGRREGEVRRCCLGDVRECRTSHLVVRMIWRKVFGRASNLGGLGGLPVRCVVNQMIIQFSEASILPSVRSSIHPFSSNHPGGKSATWNLMNSVSQTSATTFAFSYVYFFFCSNILICISN